MITKPHLPWRFRTSWPYVNRAGAYYDKGDYELAVSDYTKAIELNHSPLGYAYMSRGGVYRKFNQEEKALSDYAEAIALNYLEAYRSRGWLYTDRGEPELAIQDYTTAILKRFSAQDENPLHLRRLLRFPNA